MHKGLQRELKPVEGTSEMTPMSVIFCKSLFVYYLGKTQISSKLSNRYTEHFPVVTRLLIINNCVDKKITVQLEWYENVFDIFWPNVSVTTHCTPGYTFALYITRLVFVDPGTGSTAIFWCIRLDILSFWQFYFWFDYG